MRFSISMNALPFALLLTSAFCFAQEKDEKKTEPPEVKLCVPLAVTPGEKARLTVRGQKLDKATEVKLVEAAGEIKFEKAGGASVPNNVDAKQVGNTQVEIELTLAADTPAGAVKLVVVTPDGETPAFELLVGGAYPVHAEKESNAGFKDAQQVAVPQVVDGRIENNHDVDVYTFEGKAGQRLVAEVLAARRGSGLDASLVLYDARGQVLTYADDHADSTDAALEHTLPADGRYYLALSDANELGGPTHPYRLTLELR